MIYLVSYDICTRDADGERRLRHVAKFLERHGDRIQKSVFELNMAPDLFAKLRRELFALCDLSADSILIYQVPASVRPLMEVHGIRSSEGGDGRYVTIF